MESEVTRHHELLGRLTVKRLDLEKKWFQVNQETPISVIDEMTFEMRCLDIALIRMVKRGRLINPEMEEYTHRALTMINVILQMERDSYNYIIPAEEQEKV